MNKKATECFLAYGRLVLHGNPLRSASGEKVLQWTGISSCNTIEETDNRKYADKSSTENCGRRLFSRANRAVGAVLL